MADYEADNNSALAPNDPYKGMASAETRPKLNIISDDDKSSATSGDSRHISKDSLSNAEQSASSKPISVAKGGANQTKAAEQNQPFMNRVQGLPGENSKKQKGKGFLKKGGPLIAILSMLFGGAGLFTGVQSLAPFSLVAQFQETFDTVKTSSELRSNSFLANQLDPDRIKNPIRATMFGSSKFKVSNRQTNKLAKQGIEVDKNFTYVDAKGKSRTITVLKFDDGSGFEPIIVAPNQKIADQISGHTTVTSFDKAYSEISDFRNGYVQGSRTWRGSVAAWFDSIAVRFLQSNRITRNKFKNFQERVKAEAEGNTRSAAVAMMRDTVVDNDLTAQVNNVYGEEIEVEDSDGGTSTSTKPTTKSTSGALDFVFKGNQEAIKTKLNDLGNGMAPKVSSVMSAGVNLTCTVFNFVGAVNLMLIAHESLQIIQLISGTLEAIQKVQAGDGVDSPLNDISNGLFANADTTDENNEYLRSASAMESNSIAALYGNMPINQKDPSVSSFNISSKLDNIASNIGVAATSFMACAIAKMAAATAGAAIDIAMIATCIVSFGVGCAVQALINTGSSALFGISLAVLVSKASEILAPIVFKAFSRDIISTLAGEDLGNALVSGANMYMGTNHRSGGGSPANVDSYKEFIAAHQQVIANEAKYQRETRSPFDLSSQYTFFGSLVHSTVSFMPQIHSVSGVLAGLGNLTRNSMAALLPSASAITATNMTTSFGYCPELEAIGAVGDAFCNPYIITDISTIYTDPADIIEEISSQNLVDKENEVPEIEENSNLAKYILFCSERGSPFGIADQNIANNLTNWGNLNTGSSTINTMGNATIGAIPVLGDAIDLIQSEQALANMGYITGESCVTGNDVKKIANSSPGWDENKYYQRFVEDQRLAESMGIVEKSAVTAFLDNYYEKHPLDQSYEGILARKTGLTKNDVIAVLDQLEYYNFLANYDPSNLLPVAVPATSEPPTPIIYSSKTSTVIAPKATYIAYRSTRYRSFAA